MSKIQWTDKTWNPTTGCDKISAGCKNCYAEPMTNRLRRMGQAKYHNAFKLTTHPDSLAEPFSYPKAGCKVFVNSMSDLFHEEVPFEFIAAVFGVMAALPHHTFQVLTKRSERMREFFAWLDQKCDNLAHTTWGARRSHGAEMEACMEMAAGRGVSLVETALVGAEDFDWPLPNVWLGVSAENQEMADKRIPILLECPAAVHWVSAEPLLEGVDFSNYLPSRSGCGETFVAWIVAGGESGGKARACHQNWIGGVVDQCEAARVPVFVKQMGGNSLFLDEIDLSMTRQKFEHSKGGDPNEWPAGLRVQDFPRIEVNRD